MIDGFRILFKLVFSSLRIGPFKAVYLRNDFSEQCSGLIGYLQLEVTLPRW